MQTKHTPAPWSANGPIVRAKLRNAPARIDPEGAGIPIIMWEPPRVGNLMGVEEAEANARLIAAAPELLAFAQAVADSEIPEMVDYRYAARAAISKATGEKK